MMHAFCKPLAIGVVLLGATWSASGAPPTSRPNGERKSPPARRGTPDADAAARPPQPPKPEQVVQYQKATPEEDARAIARAQTRAKDAGEKLKIKFTELQTPHFIVFTDWDPREHAFLRRNVEAAYTAVARQFDMSPKDNIFVGKLPVFMFNKREDFARYAEEMDEFDAPRGLAGYYLGRDDGFGHMVMWKPDLAAAGGNVQQAERQWAYVLTHEFTHAFVARYKTNRHVPRWINEGLAEIVAQREFPRPGYRDSARRYARLGMDVSSIFNDEQMPPGDLYPVMMTMTEALANDNPKKFLQFFNDLKAGIDPEKALMTHYNVSYVGLEDAWREYMKRQK